MRATFALCYIHDGWRKMTMVVLNSTSASANMLQCKPNMLQCKPTHCAPRPIMCRSRIIMNNRNCMQNRNYVLRSTIVTLHVECDNNCMLMSASALRALFHDKKSHLSKSRCMFLVSTRTLSLTTLCCCFLALAVMPT